ncbi:MAG: hypothetical protein ACXVQQ_00520 [Gaiellaceae bacterium]
MRTRTGRRTGLVLAVALLAAAALVTTVAASADDGGGKADRHGDNGKHEDAARIFSAALAPSTPTDPAVHGVAAGGVPWALERGRVTISATGHIRVDLRGLVIPIAHGTFPANTARPVTTVSASLYCAPEASAAAATTASAPISESGDARIDDRISLPATCLAPTVLVHPNGGAGAYIALPGWRP